MNQDEIKKIKKTSPIVKTNQYHNDHTAQQNKGQQQKKPRHSDFLTLTEEYKPDKNQEKHQESYPDLEEKLKVDTKQWGVEVISEKILDLIKKYHQTPTNLKSFAHQIKKIINISYKKAYTALTPLPTDSHKLINATYKQTRKKLTEWIANKTEPQKLVSQPTLKNLQLEITELFLEQGRYFKEQNTLQPTINLQG